MDYWVEKTDKYITIWKRGRTCNDIVAYQEGGYADDVEAEFQIMVDALNESCKAKPSIEAEYAPFPKGYSKTAFNKENKFVSF